MSTSVSLGETGESQLHGTATALALEDRQIIVRRLQDDQGHCRSVIVAVRGGIAPPAAGSTKRKRAVDEFVPNLGIPLLKPRTAGMPHGLSRIVVAVEIVI